MGAETENLWQQQCSIYIYKSKETKNILILTLPKTKFLYIMGPPPNDALNNLLASLVEKHQVEMGPNPHRDGNWSRLLEEWNTTTGQNIKDGVIISRKWTNLKQQIKKKMSREIQYVINNAEDSSNSSINNISSITDPASSSTG